MRFNTTHMPQLASWVGFDRVFDELERTAERTGAALKSVGFPPYNIKKVDDNHYMIEMAVAGFSKTDIDITTKEDQLVIKGSVAPNTSDNFIYKGIAERAFERTFTLADTVVVKNASIVNGMLKVFLEQFIPEEKKPKKVEINDAETPDLKTVKGTKQLLTE